MLADAYNKTAVPLATAPKAKNTMTQENQVSINGDIDSVRHVNFKAGKGMTTVSTSAREYNIYKGTSGSGSVTSTALGEVTPGETVANYVDIASGKGYAQVSIITWSSPSAAALRLLILSLTRAAMLFPVKKAA